MAQNGNYPTKQVQVQQPPVHGAKEGRQFESRARLQRGVTKTTTPKNSEIGLDPKKNAISEKFILFRNFYCMGR